MQCLGTMRAVMIMVLIGVGCAGEPAPCAASQPAYDGFRWACTHAPPCSTAVACADPRWPYAPGDTLDALAVCLLEPCEVRQDCMIDAVAPCQALR